MKSVSAIASPQLLQISAGGGVSCYGAAQTWYRKAWQRLAGCGPTTASHLLYYLAATRKECVSLAPVDGSQRQGFVELMEQIWNYVTPGLRGVNSTRLFVNGVERYGQNLGVFLHSSTFEVPAKRSERPALQALSQFLTDAFDEDVPVAFLNLDNGEVSNLDRWHWVTLVEYNPDTHIAIMYDQGLRSPIDLNLWFRSSRLGGGFVRVLPA